MIRPSDSTPDFFRSLVLAAPVPMFTLAVEDGSLTSTNPAFDMLTGHRNAPGVSFNAYLHGDDEGIFISNLHQAMLGERPPPFELRVVTPIGSYQVSELTLLPELRDGRLVQLLGFVKDLSERRSIVRNLRAARDAAEAGSHAKTEFLANMSHEIRTPLNAVVALSGLLVEMGLDAQAHSFSEIIRSSSENLLGLINSVLDFSKIESEKLELENQPFSIVECVRSAVDMVANQASEKGLVIETQLEAACPPAIYGDITRVRQVLANLLSNAVKFTEEGSVSVAVSVSAAPPSDDSGSMRPADEAKVELVFEVRDTGIGIPPDKQAKIFDVFSQADASTTRRFGGTGLGLTISRRLTELMGGSISVHSSPGSGSTFRFSIRGRPSDESTASAERSRAVDADLSKKLPLRILVAEDHPTNQLVARLLLGKMGYEPEVVDDGRQAVDAVMASRYDVVLMDIHMPVMDGLAATREIHERLGENAPWIVAVTASMLKGDRERCLAAGVDEFLGKPLFDHELEAMLRLVAGYREDTPSDSEEAAPRRMSRMPPEAIVMMPNPAGNLPMLDMPTFDGLMRLGGANAQRLMDSFVDSAWESVDTIGRLLAAGDAENLGKSAHGIKGSSAVFGAKRVEAVCASIERRGRGGTLDGVATELEVLKLELDKVSKELRRLLAERDG